MNRVKKMFVLPFMILSFLMLPLKTYAVDDVPELTTAPITTGITTTVIDDIPEPTAVPAATENTTTTTTPVTTDITTTETTVVTTSIPIVTSVSPITSLYQRAYHLDINNLPNKTNYNIGDELDLTGLKVDLTYNNESNIYHNTDYINAYPLDYPDVFTVDTSKFDNSKAGTYTIEISCKYEYLHWFPPSAYLKVTVNDSGSSTTTTSTSTTDITTTETTVVTTQIPTVTSVVYTTTAFVIYESAYVHSLKSPPDKTVYEIGDELDLTGLKVDLEFYDQQGGHRTIYRDAYPPDNPDFIVDTSDFDSSKAGTYKIKVSCADKFTAFYLPGPVYFEVTVNDSNPAATTTSTSTTKNTTTTTVTTTVTTEADTEQTTDAGGSVTTETSTVPPTTTTGTETTLPQTGYSKWYQVLIAAAMGMIGVGSTAIVKSGIFRKKENNS